MYKIHEIYSPYISKYISKLNLKKRSSSVPQHSWATIIQNNVLHALCSTGKELLDFNQKEKLKKLKWKLTNLISLHCIHVLKCCTVVHKIHKHYLFIKKWGLGLVQWLRCLHAILECLVSSPSSTPYSRFFMQTGETAGDGSFTSNDCHLHGRSK